MASPRLMLTNLVDTSTITASSEDAVLVADNVANALRTKVWQTGTSTADESIVFNHGSAKSITCVILLDHDLTAGDSGIVIEGNDADSWGTPAFSQALTRVAGPIAAYFTTKTNVYNRIAFTKSASGETRSIGRVFLGTYIESVVAGTLRFRTRDLSKHSRAIGGQEYSDIRPNFDQINVGMELVDKADKDTLKPLFETVGTHTPFFVSLNNDVEPVDWIYYVKNSRIPGWSAVSSTNYWSTMLSMNEQL